MNTKSMMFTTVISIYLLLTLTHAVSIYPSNINVEDVLTVGQSNISTFTLRNDHPYDMNLTFEITSTSDYLSSYVIFDPSNVTLVRANESFNFNVTITPTSSLSNGTHLLIFRPRGDILKGIEENVTGIAIRGNILTVSAASINFIFEYEEEVAEEEELPPVTIPSGGGTHVKKEIKNLEIEAPVFVKLVEGRASIEIKLRNTGEIDLKNLAIDLMPNNKINLDYNKTIGDLDISEEKTVRVHISNSSVSRNTITINISDYEDSWTKDFVVYRPKIPEVLPEKVDCIVFEPKEFVVDIKQKTYLNLTVINLCNFSLHELEIRIDEIDYIQEIEMIQESIVIHPSMMIEEGKHVYEVDATYTEGESKESITVYSLNYKRILDEIKQRELALKKIKQRLNIIPLVLNRDGIEEQINDVENKIEYSKLLLDEEKLVDSYTLLTQIQELEEKLLNNLSIQMLLNIIILLLLFSLVFSIPFIGWTLEKRRREERLKKKILRPMRKIIKYLRNIR